MEEHVDSKNEQSQDNRDKKTESSGSTHSSFEDLHNECYPEGVDPGDKPTEVTEEWMDVLGSGCLMKKVLKPGHPESSRRPIRGDHCTIKYTETVDGEIVDEQETIVQVGDLEVVPGLDLIVPMMDLGETSLVKIESRLAYGDQGLPPKIPGGATVHYEIELLEIQPDVEPKELTARERKAMGDQKRERGNFWYLRGESNYAIQCYRRALEYLDEAEGGMTEPSDLDELPPTDAELQELLEERIKVHNNIAAAQVKIGSFDAAIKSLNIVLQCQPNNVKALFRKGQALMGKNELKEAYEVLKKAVALVPNNAAVQAEQQKIKMLVQKQNEKEKLLAKRMFGESPAPKKTQTKTVRTKTRLMRRILVPCVVVAVSFFAYYTIKLR